MGFSERNANICLLLPTRLDTDMMVWARGPVAYEVNDKFLGFLAGPHRSSKLRGFRVRTCAVTAAPPKRPFWQLWRLPKAFSRGETCFSPICNLQEAHKSSRLRGFRVRTSAVTAAPPKRPFWQLWRTCFSPICSLQEAHRSSRLRGFRVRTFAVTAAPPKRPFWQFWRPPKPFSRRNSCFT